MTLTFFLTRYVRLGVTNTVLAWSLSTSHVGDSDLSSIVSVSKLNCRLYCAIIRETLLFWF